MKEYNKSYMITAREIDILYNVISYFKYHNKNLTKAQDWYIYVLEQIAEHLEDRYTGPADKNTDYLNDI